MSAVVRLRAACTRLLGRVVACTAFAALTLAARTSHANGRFPASGQVVFAPTDPQMIVVRATFGVLVSRDGGNTWSWICEAPLALLALEDPMLVVMADTSIVEASFGGLRRGTAGGCTWGYVNEALTRFVVIDDTAARARPHEAFAVTSNGGAPNGVWKTADDGATWAPLGERTMGLFFETIDVAPSDGSRLYLTGAIPPTSTMRRQPFVFRSRDGGETFQRFPYTLGENEQNLYLAGVDPVRPDRVFIRVSSDARDRLLVSDDGGETLREVLTLQDMLGFAIAPDGQTVWAGGPDDGLWRSDDSGEHFTQVGTTEVSCLAAREGELWACGHAYRDDFLVGKSTDGGAHFTPMLTVDRVDRVLACPRDSEVTLQCVPQLPMLMDTLVPEGFRDAGVPPAPDAGATRPEPPAPKCSCRVAGKMHETHGFAALAVCGVAALTWMVRAQRRRSRGASSMRHREG